jgi:hypothetical protein
MKTKPLTNAEGEVRGLTWKDIQTMQPAEKVLPPELLPIVPKGSRSQNGLQKSLARMHK